MLWKDEGGITGSASDGALDDGVALRVRIHQRLLDMLNLSALDKAGRESLRVEIRAPVGQLLAEEKRLLTPVQTDQLIEDVLDELLGLGPLEPLLNDDSISDILINTHATVYVERRGRLEMTDVHFHDTRHLVRIINKIVSAVGRRVDESQPMVDARLPDGSRVNAIIPPLAVDGPLVSIRKFAAVPIHMARLVELGSISSEMAEVMQAIVKARRNVLISGGTGSGKTTLLNALSAFIDGAERIVTIEDSAELQLQQPHVGRLETRPPNLEDRGEVTQRDLLRNALRMRPDRIIVGEVRAGEAFDMLQAMNTGHDGSMTTVHANTPRDALSRIEQMIGMAGLELSPRSIRQQIASAINVVVQVERLEDGNRKLVSISEIVGMEEEVISMQEIFRFRRQGLGKDGVVKGEYETTGVRPRFMDVLAARGMELPSITFTPARRQF
ncbi:MAG: type secretion system protein [Phenylobacterium sp.]|jgi:pilus assembly protein CpaF|uniref:CpaF family protein n=1 Tax=Phenylobacterium sp. TaxID=1871053 RepID=UPI00261674E1|nr:CpaF family protein [Phenylobacterium sp.]MDB5428365.1 type secretion system protein [Phenylobacterium sp.]MDB5435559.1 type secretion system protein [Phenylobacterium sp.]MDB5463857.1 type secretion system protein [Phenylobacterium sp.]MDB5499311.1 type secretion system protein [Phenylobacterium sp.]